ncbi:YigZ family protein [Macrococcus sp. DPC7161]|uniref:YigZ family protein n=1 Tax=Macrococcus sp. DPC7161 TaxID=2507060 RepID=UPI00100BFE8D|nr:YigZ family protein [Macrococcus sp. DPC7161]RXK18034.1 YigZ family protein [Macrococcus sp. DPC7161]
MKNYITIQSDVENETIINKSRFITYLFKVDSEDEAKTKIDEIKALHKTANHNCSAYTIGDSHQIQKANDDGEPSGTAGVPMLECLKKADIHNTVAIVTRYFGGIKLGTGGLIRAYQNGVSEAISKSGKAMMKNAKIYRVTIQYDQTGKFEHQIESTDFIVLNTIYTDKVTYEIQITNELEDEFKQFITNQTQGTAEMLLIEEKMLPFNL